MLGYARDDLDDLVSEEAVGDQVGFDVSVELAQGLGELGEGSATGGFECYCPIILGEAGGNVLEFGEEDAIYRFGILVDGIAALTIELVGMLLLRGADGC